MIYGCKKMDTSGGQSDSPVVKNYVSSSEYTAIAIHRGYDPSNGIRACSNDRMAIELSCG